MFPFLKFPVLPSSLNVIVSFFKVSCTSLINLSANFLQTNLSRKCRKLWIPKIQILSQQKVMTLTDKLNVHVHCTCFYMYMYWSSKLNSYFKVEENTCILYRCHNNNNNNNQLYLGRVTHNSNSTDELVALQYGLPYFFTIQNEEETADQFIAVLEISGRPVVRLKSVSGNHFSVKLKASRPRKNHRTTQA